jgi:hypothetical protein
MPGRRHQKSNRPMLVRKKKGSQGRISPRQWHGLHMGCLGNAKACHGLPRQWHGLQRPCQELPRKWRELQQPCQDNAKAMQYHGRPKQWHGLQWPCQGMRKDYTAMPRSAMAIPCHVLPRQCQHFPKTFFQKFSKEKKKK